MITMSESERLSEDRSRDARVAFATVEPDSENVLSFTITEPVIEYSLKTSGITSSKLISPKIQRAVDLHRPAIGVIIILRVFGCNLLRGSHTRGVC